MWQDDSGNIRSVIADEDEFPELIARTSRAHAAALLSVYAGERVPLCTAVMRRSPTGSLANRADAKRPRLGTSSAPRVSAPTGRTQMPDRPANGCWQASRSSLLR
ncbi:hypothetical protein GCM10010313_29310 [Streptomyces violarus]|nr:hypothetical protein GCM10010313_29310 [Streptomyces violarus]